jgi:hypothetical protein
MDSLHATAIEDLRALVLVLLTDYGLAADAAAREDSAAARRAQLRAGLALVDGASSALRAIARADVAAGRIVLAAPEATILSGEAGDLLDDGAPRIRPAFYSAHRLVKFSFLVAAKAFRMKFAPEIADPGWRDLGVAMGLRHRLMHATQAEDLLISDADWAIASRGLAWFKAELDRFVVAAGVSANAGDS